MAEFFSLQNLKNLWQTATSGHAYILTAAVFAVLLLLRTLILSIAYRNLDDQFVRLRYKRGISYFFLITAIVLLLPVWLPSIRSIATFLGIFGAGFLLVFKDLWLCVGGWAYVMIRRPYVIGDRIQVGNVTGDVIDIRLMETSIMEISNNEGGLNTGRIIYFPNAKIFTETIATTNRRFAHVYQEIEVQLAVTADWQLAANLLEAIAREQYETAFAAKEQQEQENDEQDFLSGYREPRVLVEMRGALVVLHLQLMIPTGQVANMTDRIWRAFLAAAKENPAIRFTGSLPTG